MPLLIHSTFTHWCWRYKNPPRMLSPSAYISITPADRGSEADNKLMQYTSHMNSLIRITLTCTMFWSNSFSLLQWDSSCTPPNSLVSFFHLFFRSLFWLGFVCMGALGALRHITTTKWGDTWGGKHAKADKNKTNRYLSIFPLDGRKSGAPTYCAKR